MPRPAANDVRLTDNLARENFRVLFQMLLTASKRGTFCRLTIAFKDGVLQDTVGAEMTIRVQDHKTVDLADSVYAKMIQRSETT